MVGAFSYNTDFAETEVDERQRQPDPLPPLLPGEADVLPGRLGDLQLRHGRARRRVRLRPVLQPPHRPLRRRAGPRRLRRQGLRQDRRYQPPGPRRPDAARATTSACRPENFLVARVSQNVLAESKVGAVFTDRQPDRSPKNSLAGFDAVYQTSRLFERQELPGRRLVRLQLERRPGGPARGLRLRC
ncbi:MAG: hypothetical protein M0C28_32315 [Candidatus Moduliflexus flocculans]|nr:hypothetical protein [Candidatus Moduliflexus flocculans]